jgi:N-acyl-D-aspartate/D-glutamate deacylase
VIPTAHTPEPELRAIAMGMRDAGGGAIQAILNVQAPLADLEMFCRISAETGCPFSFSLLQLLGAAPDSWRELLAFTEQANRRGIQVTAQVYPRPVGVLLGLDASYHPFSAYPAYVRIARLPLSERVAEMRKPEVRAAILSDKPEARGMLFYYTARLFDTIYPLGDPPNYEPARADSVAARAAARGVTPDEIAYDLLLEDEGRALLLQTIANYVEGDLEAVRGMLTAPHTVPALGDGGAHYGTICDASYTTYLLAYWGRDRASGKIALPQIVRSLTATPAEVLGLKDRGRIAAGLKADLNVIDFDRLSLHAPRTIRDLPSGGRRLTQDADGYAATIVSGQIIRRDGKPTGALPGAIIRHAAC